MNTIPSFLSIAARLAPGQRRRRSIVWVVGGGLFLALFWVPTHGFAQCEISFTETQLTFDDLTGRATWNLGIECTKTGCENEGCECGVARWPGSVGLSFNGQPCPAELDCE